MCLTLYVASDKPIRAKADEAFSIESLWDTCGFEKRPIIRHQFSKPHVMYLGAYEGCACGFGKHGERGRLSLDSLRMFLKEQLERVEELELYGCWIGDETEPPEERLEVTPDHFGQSFDFYVFYRVRKAAERGVAADEAR